MISEFVFTFLLSHLYEWLWRYDTMCQILVLIYLAEATRKLYHVHFRFMWKIYRNIRGNILQIVLQYTWHISVMNRNCNILLSLVSIVWVSKFDWFCKNPISQSSKKQFRSSNNGHPFVASTNGNFIPCTLRIYPCSPWY